MIKITNVKTALDLFEEACIMHYEATLNGDFKKCNRYYDKILKSITFLKSENAISNLKDFLFSPYVAVRLWAACYWLPVNEQEGITVLNEIINTPGIISLTAETTLSEWKKGNLKF